LIFEEIDVTLLRGFEKRVKLLQGRVVPKYEEGDFIKVEFSDETTGIGEWMWVRVQRCDEEHRLVFGVLDNVPVATEDDRLTLGTELAISFDRIREHRKPSEFLGLAWR
jgi:hypothetical protein